MERTRKTQQPTPNAASTRKALRDALRKAVNLEQRFGIREDARTEVEAAWDHALQALEQHIG